MTHQHILISFLFSVLCVRVIIIILLKTIFQSVFTIGKPSLLRPSDHEVPLKSPPAGPLLGSLGRGVGVHPAPGSAQHLSALQCGQDRGWGPHRHRQGEPEP